jgi:hypothetical protein
MLGPNPLIKGQLSKDRGFEISINFEAQTHITSYTVQSQLPDCYSGSRQFIQSLELWRVLGILGFWVFMGICLVHSSLRKHQLSAKSVLIVLRSVYLPILTTLSDF